MLIGSDSITTLQGRQFPLQQTDWGLKIWSGWLRREQLCSTAKAKAQLFWAVTVPFPLPFPSLPTATACVGALESAGSLAFLSFPVNVCLSRGSVHVQGPKFVPFILLCCGHTSYHRDILCGWPPPKITRVCIALFSSIKFKECARQIRSPKIISFYWHSKLPHGAVSWAKLKLSYSKTQGFLLSGNRFLSVWELYCFLPLRETVLRGTAAQSRSVRTHFMWQRLLV